MNKKSLLSLNILTADGAILQKENLEAVNVLLTDELPLGIRPGHAPLIAETKTGPIVYRTSKSEQKIEIHAGIMNIRDNIVTILTPGEVAKLPADSHGKLKTEYERLLRAVLEAYQPNDDQ